MAFGRLGRRCSFAPGGKGTKTPPGDGSDERLRGAGAHSHLSPGPPITGDSLLEDRHLRPAAPNTRPCVLLAPAHGGLSGQKLRSVRAVQTPPTLAKPWQLGKYRCPTDHRRTKQVGRHQAVRNRSSSLQILLAERPCGLRVGRKQVLILPAGVYQKPEVTRPRKMGVQGGDAYEHRRKPGVHRRRPPAGLWFLSDRSERNPPRRAGPSIEI